MFAPGQSVTLDNDRGQHFIFTIVRPFAPFTKSVVLLVRCADVSSEPIILKIYDPRFLDDRLGLTPVDPSRPAIPSRPWSLENERAAPDTYDEDDLWEESPAPDDVAGHTARAALWEAHYQYLSTECFDSEHAAYTHLQHLQGAAIPRLLMEGVLVPPDERAYRPPALVMEYVKGVVFRDAPVEELTRDLCTALVSAVDSFGAHEVFHNDLNENNIIVAPGRAVVIDFGCAGIRQPEQDDESWSFNVAFANDVGRVQNLLRHKGVSNVDELVATTSAA